MSIMQSTLLRRICASEAEVSNRVVKRGCVKGGGNWRKVLDADTIDAEWLDDLGGGRIYLIFAWRGW